MCILRSAVGGRLCVHKRVQRQRVTASTLVSASGPGCLLPPPLCLYLAFLSARSVFSGNLAPLLHGRVITTNFGSGC